MGDLTPTARTYPSGGTCWIDVSQPDVDAAARMAEIGAQLTNLPGAWNFSNLHTFDPAAAGEFCTAALDWRLSDQGWATTISVPGYGDQLAATSDPDIHVRQRDAPEGFADVIETIGPTVLPTGADDWTRWAAVRDPQGAMVTLSQFTATDG